MSDRMVSDLARGITPSSIRKIFNLSKGMTDVISFGIGEPDFNTPRYIINAARKSMDDGYTHYTVNAGFPELRECISAKLKTENEIAADPIDEVIVTAGGMGGLYLALRSMLDPGDDVLVPQPSWLNYVAQITLAGGNVVPVPLDSSDGFTLTADKIAAQVTRRTKVLLFNTPSNPTGKVVPKEELKKIAKLARERGFFILSDEVYEKFIWDGRAHASIASIPDAADITVTVNSFSKSYAMTGWRIGYACGNKEIVSSMVKLQENIYACANSVAQRAAIAALTCDDGSLGGMLMEYESRKKLLTNIVSQVEGLKIIPCEGSFYMFVDISRTGLSSEDFAMRLLAKHRLAVIPGDAFGPTGSGFVRMAYTVGSDSLIEGGNRLQDFISSLN
jgi:aminotransferase